jgi:predicted Kef-type K+ transport protein
MEQGLVTDIAICIIAAWAVAVVSQVARQPLLLAYLVAGFAVGPHGIPFHKDGTSLVTDPESIQTISAIGLSLLLFMIGLEIDLKRMLSAGRVITLTAGAQILGCVLLGWLVFGLLGPAQTHLEALYLAVAAAMSSTVIIVKILYDKRELETLAGRVTLGVLVLQDIATILFLAIQPNLKHPEAGVMLHAVGNVILLVAVAFLASRFVLPKIFKFIARLPELVLVGALAWCFAMAGFADYLKLSTAMGALIAGVMLSTFPYTLDVAAKVTSLRDFFRDVVLRGPGDVDPGADGDVHVVDDFPVPHPDRDPAGDGLSRAVFDETRLSCEPAAGDQPVPDERAVAGAAGAGQKERRCLGQHHRHLRVRVRVPGGRFDVCHPGQRHAAPEGDAVAEEDGSARP